MSKQKKRHSFLDVPENRKGFSGPQTWPKFFPRLQKFLTAMFATLQKEARLTSHTLTSPEYKLNFSIPSEWQ